MEQKYIKYVAIYLRKSRGDIDSDLEKHKKVLTELCEENQWTYVIYAEVESGDSIYMRSVFQRLLEDIRSEIFDAVVVMDIDRLGRGDEGDQAEIKKAFAKSNTYVVTPQQVYNLNNVDDKFIIDMKTFIARQEYTQTVKRLTQGKKIGSRLGSWTNGRPPYPYEYERYESKYNPKGLVVNDEKLKIYRYIVDSVVKEGKTPNNIAYELNKSGIPSPKNSIWHGVTIGRILADETHLGKIISNKTKGDGHVKKKPDTDGCVTLSKNEWIIKEDRHEAVKTQDEHDKILLFMSRLGRKPRRKTKDIYPLSGLIKCGLCGHTTTIHYRPERKNPESLKACWYKDAEGNKCTNRGMDTSFIYSYINEDILNYKEELKKKINNSLVVDRKEEYEKAISSLNQELSKKQQAITRILDAFENGIYNLNEFKERKMNAEKAISDIGAEIEILTIKSKQFNEESIVDKINKIEKFENSINQDDLSNAEKNELYKSIIESIIWTRIGNDITLEVKFK